MRRPILGLGIGGSVLLALVIGWWYFLPTPLFTVPYSTVILDKEGEIMGMTVASDGQYRVSGRGRLSMKYMAALLCFEDKRFLTHSGVDPLAVGRGRVSAWSTVFREALGDLWALDFTRWLSAD